MTHGPERDALLGADDLDDVVFSVTSSDPARLRDATVILDGARAAGGRVEGEQLLWRPGELADGEHRVEVVVPRSFPLRDKRATWTFTVDTTPPDIAVDVPAEPVPYDAPVTLSAAVEEGARIDVAGADVEVDGGEVSIAFATPPLTAFDVVVEDEAGNEAVHQVELPVELPEVRAVHMTAAAWAADSLREPVLKMIDEGRINAIELDLKDEAGIVGYDSKVERAIEIGAVKPLYDLEEVIEDLHAKGVRVLGRIVVFRDPVLAAFAWEAGERDQVIQSPDGRPYAKYGGFTNFAHAEVRDYNVDLAVEAAEAGIDEILYDYVRRPDGDIEGMVFPGIDETPEQEIVGFLRESRERLREIGTIQGASVFGIAATRPDEIAQDIPEMAKVVDYVAPMVYPSHWGPGEYGVRNPNAQPYDIVKASMEDFQLAVAGTGARVVPWLQDFTLGVTYGPAEVKAQIDAARDAGIDEWIMWDPRCTYTVEAYEPRPRESDVEQTAEAAAA